MRGNINISVRGVLALLAILCLTASSAQAGIVLISDNPSTGAAWAIGDTYRFAFVSSATTPATSTDITTYNAFVQGLADASPLNIGASDGFTWNVIGSTSTVDARDNTSSNTTVNGSGEATLLVDGMTVIANDYADLWNNNIDNPLNINENGVGGLTGTVFTGSYPDGTKIDRALGGSTETPPKVTIGRVTDTNSYWMRVYNAATTSSLPVYALSDPVSLGGELMYWDLNDTTTGAGSATPTTRTRTGTLRLTAPGPRLLGRRRARRPSSPPATTPTEPTPSPSAARKTSPAWALRKERSPFRAARHCASLTMPP